MIKTSQNNQEIYKLIKIAYSVYIYMMPHAWSYITSNNYLCKSSRVLLKCLHLYFWAVFLCILSWWSKLNRSTSGTCISDRSL